MGTSEPTTHDVIVVGGGPAGCSAALFAARYGLDTVVFECPHHRMVAPESDRCARGVACRSGTIDVFRIT